MTLLRLLAAVFVLPLLGVGLAVAVGLLVKVLE